MQIFIAALLVFVAFVVLCRLLWLRLPRRPSQRQQPAAGTMSRERALEILGLGPQPSRDDVLAAHRRLIQRLHPDRGGSTYLTQQLNEAKERLLGDL